MKETRDFVPSPRMKFALVPSLEMTRNSFRITSNTCPSDMKLWPKIAFCKQLVFECGLVNMLLSKVKLPLSTKSSSF